MDIPLDQFEQIIDEIILKRGYDYFRRGLVETTVKLSPGHYTAIIQGAEPHEVKITIHDEIVTDSSCTCPYDMGPVCKHVVALLFALQEELKGLKMQRGKPSEDPLMVQFTHHAGSESKSAYAQQVKSILAAAKSHHSANPFFLWINSEWIH